MGVDLRPIVVDAGTQEIVRVLSEPVIFLGGGGQPEKLVNIIVEFRVLFFLRDTCHSSNAVYTLHKKVKDILYTLHKKS